MTSLPRRLARVATPATATPDAAGPPCTSCSWTDIREPTSCWTEFGIDNGPFVGALRERDFTVAKQSRSNYTVTALTLASMFGGGVRCRRRRVPPGPRPINEGPVLQAFRGRATRWSLLVRVRGRGPSPGRQVHRQRPTERVRVGAAQAERARAGAGPGAADAAWPTSIVPAWRNVRRGAVLVAQPTQRPRIAFVHVPIPHSPQVFGPYGEPIRMCGACRCHFTTARNTGSGSRGVRSALGRADHLPESASLELVDAIVEADRRLSSSSSPTMDPASVRWRPLRGDRPRPSDRQSPGGPKPRAEGHHRQSLHAREPPAADPPGVHGLGTRRHARDDLRADRRQRLVIFDRPD